MIFFFFLHLLCSKLEDVYILWIWLSSLLEFTLSFYMLCIISCEFFTLTLADGLLLESEWQQVSPGFRFLTELNNNVFWMVLARPPIFKFSSSCTKPFRTVPSSPITFGITIIFRIYSFFSIITLWEFFTPAFFYWSPSDSKSPLLLGDSS